MSTAVANRTRAKAVVVRNIGINLATLARRISLVEDVRLLVARKHRLRSLTKHTSNVTSNSGTLSVYLMTRVVTNHFLSFQSTPIVAGGSDILGP